MFVRIGVMRAPNRHVERVFNPDRKDHHWGRRNRGKPMTSFAPSGVMTAILPCSVIGFRGDEIEMEILHVSSA